MIKLASLLLFAVSAHCYYIEDGSSENVKEKIVGGEKIPIEEAPYLAQIILDGVQRCGGAIISEKWILTAAHCVQITYGLTVITGSSKRGQGKKRRVATVHVHKDYDTNTYDNDIALIELKKKIIFNSRQKPIALSAKIPKANEEVKISGFGRVGEYDFPSFDLKSAIAPVISHEECEKRYTNPEDKISDNMFCAGNGETDSCQGDSGGPAVIDGELSGVISTGLECASSQYPGVYTYVYKYRQWIASKTQLDL